jgi:hypothetical protein
MRYMHVLGNQRMKCCGKEQSVTVWPWVWQFNVQRSTCVQHDHVIMFSTSSTVLLTNGNFLLCEWFPVTPVPSHPGSPTAGTPNASCPSSPIRTEESTSASPVVHHSIVACSHAEVEQHRGRLALRRHPHFDVDSTTRSAKSYLHGTLFHSHKHHHGTHMHPCSRASITMTICVNALLDAL